MRIRRCLPVVFALFVLTIPFSLSAQTVTGSVGGTVTDATGAVVPNAHVTALNTATGVATQATTNGAGIYSIRFLPIGQYQVTVEAPGFTTAKLPPFALEVAQTVKFDAHLQTGAATTTVDVKGDVAPILNTNDPTIGTTFTANTVRNIPLNGLDFSALTLYTPGTVTTYGTQGPTSIERSTFNSDIPNINGNRAQANNYTLDGIDLNETQNNLIGYSPAPESLQEIRILTANSPADYGNVNGGGVVSVLKSGTNSFHGSVYGYTQNANYNANTWANNHANPIVPINSFSQSQFGGTFGGPILHDKLFFFVDYLGARFHQGGLEQDSVFTAAQRGGDFSVLLSGANGNTPVQLYDSQNNFAPYVNNKLPATTNPVALYLFAHPNLYPLPNAAPTDGIAQNDLQGPSRSFKANNQGDIKIEYDPRAADKITAFVSIGTAFDGKTPFLAISFPTANNYPTKLGGANWVHVFSPAIVNSARIGFTRVQWAQGVPTDPSGIFGLNGNSIVGIGGEATQNYPGYAAQNISGNITAGGNAAFVGSIIDNTYSYIDNLTWQKGQHLLSIGVQAIRYQNAYITDNNAGFLGQLSYTGDYTSNPSVTGAAGYGGADFLLNRVREAQVTSQGIFVGQRQWRAAGFIQDDWKIMPNLTLNIGLRYEYDQPWYEQNNKTGNIDLATGVVEYASRVPAGAPPNSTVCDNRACYQPNYTQFMPRLGFAFQATPRFVLRGGYGATSFFEGNAANQRLTSITPFVQSVDIKQLAPTAPGNGQPATGGNPRTVQEGFAATASDVNFNGSTYNIYPQNIQPAYLQEWNLTTEYAVTSSMSLQVGYLGEQGQHIEDYGNVNQYLVNGDPTTAPYFNDTNLGIGSNRLLITESRATSNYNALQVVLRERVSHGLEFTANYAYGKALTNSVGNYGVNTSGFSGAFQDYRNSHADYGPAGYDIKHNFSAIGVYDLPFGRGKQFASNLNRVADEAVGGWKFSTAIVSYSGFPETITSPDNSNSNTYGQIRANQYLPLKIVHRSINNWYGTDPSATPCTQPGSRINALGVACAFGVPASNTFGTSTNGSTRGPGYLNVDMSAFKDFVVFREQTLGFRFDAFNALNIASYGNPDVGVADTTFGQIASQGTPVRSQERHLQFSANYRF
jgi:hypothetical protein